MAITDGFIWQKRVNRIANGMFVSNLLNFRDLQYRPLINGKEIGRGFSLNFSFIDSFQKKKRKKKATPTYPSIFSLFYLIVPLWASWLSVQTISCIKTSLTATDSLTCKAFNCFMRDWVALRCTNWLIAGLRFFPDLATTHSCNIPAKLTAVKGSRTDCNKRKKKKKKN